MIIKRIFDFLFSGIALLLLSPAMMIIAIFIYLQDGESPIFRQERVGQYGMVFIIFKFRSMSVSTINVPSTQTNNLKITNFGKIIRRTNLDELPQLFNILIGNMSFVGPRPALKTQNLLLELRKKNGVANCKPGLTGMAQVNSFDGMSEVEKAEWDAKYARNYSFLLDIKLILKTFIYMTRKPPVY